MSERDGSLLRSSLLAVLDEGVRPVTAAEARRRAETERTGGARAHGLWPAVTPRRLGAIGALSMALVVLLAVGLLATMGPASSGRRPSQLSTGELLAGKTGPCAAGAPGCGSPESSPAALATGRWEALPPGPLTERAGEVEVWTGTELVVWGGSSPQGASGALNDGAAYDPATRRWRMLPRSPLEGVENAAGIWTGNEMVVIGGEKGPGKWSSEVAAYVPSTRSWHRLPSLPTGPLGDPRALWTGRQIVVLGGAGQSSRGYREVSGAVFDPSTGRWGRLPKVPLPAPSASKWRAIAIVPAWTGTSLELFLTWQRSGSCGKGCYSAYKAAGAWSLPAGASSWDALAKPSVQLGGAVAAWTGRGVLVAGGTYCPDSCPPPIPFAGLYSPSTDRWTEALGSDSVTSFPGVWTGRAFVAFRAATRWVAYNSQQLAAWSPASGRWTRLAAPPPGLQDVGQPAVWTGNELIIWGAHSLALVVAPPG